MEPPQSCSPCRDRLAVNRREDVADVQARRRLWVGQRRDDRLPLHFRRSPTGGKVIPSFIKAGICAKPCES